LGVRFLLGGAYTFLGAAADQLHNRRVALKDLWGRPAIELQTRLMEAKTREARFERIERAFLSRLADAVRPHPAIAKAISRLVAQHGASSVTDVALRFGLSQRRFIELFQREVGLSPKTLCRVLRFQWALRLITDASRPNLAALAVDCGYYDQSHLIRDFKAFTGVTPTAYHHSRAGPCPGGHFKAPVGVTPTAYPARRGRRHNHAPMGEGGQIYPISGQASSLE
jgi:AraC-like DNA-binding protein